MIVKTATGEIITRQQLMAEFEGLTLPLGLTDVDLSEFGAVLVEQTEQPAPVAGKIWDLDGAELADGAWRLKWVQRPATPEELDAERNGLLALAANLRWQKEVGGVSISGVAIATDDRTKVMVAGARVMAENDPSFVTQWKTSGNVFVPLDAPTIIAISNAIGAHVAACFALEAQVIAGILSGDIDGAAGVAVAFA